MSADVNPNAVDVALVEFANLRAEILQKNTTQNTLFGLNVTVIATIIGLVISEKASIQTLVVVPLISSAIELHVLRHDADVVLIARYIRTRLAPTVNGFLAHEQLLNWETYYANEVRTQRTWFLPPMASAISPIASIGILAITVFHLSSPIEWTAWGIGLAFSIVRLGVAFRYLYGQYAN